MSRIFARFTGNANVSRLDTKFHKITNSSQSSTPSMSDLHEIAIFSFNHSQLQIINKNLLKNLQVVNPTSTKSLLKYLVKLQKTLAIFQYLVQVGSEEFINCWKDVNGVPNPTLAALSENLEQIENSNLCQDQGYTYGSSSATMKNSIRNSLSGTINKLSRLRNYLGDEEELEQFRLSFQKLRFDMSKPTPRSSIDNQPRMGLNRSKTMGRVTAGRMQDSDDDFDRIDFKVMEPSIDINNVVSKRSSLDNKYAQSKSLDLNRLTKRSAASKQVQKSEFKNFSEQLSMLSSDSFRAKSSSPLASSIVDSSAISPVSDLSLGPLIEVNEQ